MDLETMLINNLKEENKELREQLADAEEHIDNLELQLREQYQLVDEKDEEIAQLEKALELACECLDEHFWDCCPEIYSSTKEDWLNDFKTKAKEMIKSE